MNQQDKFRLGLKIVATAILFGARYSYNDVSGLTGILDGIVLFAIWC